MKERRNHVGILVALLLLCSSAMLLEGCSENKSEQLPDTIAADSYTMLPLFLGEEGNGRTSLVKQSGNGILSIQQGTWKLIMSSGSGGSWSKPQGALPYAEWTTESPVWKNVQLFNLGNDLSEKNNVAGQHPGITAELAELLASQIINGRTTDGPALKNDGPGTWKQVEWIRYINNRTEE